VEGRGFLTGAIIDDKLQEKLQSMSSQDGIINNHYLPGETDSTKLWGTRAQSCGRPGELRLLGGVDFTHDTSPYKVQQLIGNFQPSNFPPLSYGPSDTDQRRTPGRFENGAASSAPTMGAIGTIHVDYGLPHADSAISSRHRRPLDRDSQVNHVGADQSPKRFTCVAGRSTIGW